MNNKINEIKIQYHTKTALSDPITSSQLAFQLVFEHWNSGTIGLQETFKIVLLDNANKVKGVFELSKGSITATLVDLRILFAVVLKSLSVGIILVHNHPSGKLIPSQMDKQLTKKIQKAATLFDIKVLDHLILSPQGSYYSFADNGIL